MENKLYLENLTFSYHDDKKILDRVNLGLKPGNFAAVVGKSGSGKSTLFHLLVGLYVPDGGRLYLHTDGRDLSAEEYRDRTGVVFQDHYLFAGDGCGKYHPRAALCIRDGDREGLQKSGNLE